MSDIIKASLEGIKSFSHMDTAFGNAINTPSGVTVIPVSKVAMGVATGGVDYADKQRCQTQNFGGGGGSGLSITPIAFLTVGVNGEINLININNASADVDRIASLIEHTPELIEKIKAAMS